MQAEDLASRSCEGCRRKDGLTATVVGCVGGVAQLVGPGDRRAEKGSWRRGGGQQEGLVSVGRGK